MYLLTNDLPVSIDSLTIQWPFNKTASQTTVPWYFGNSMTSPGTNSALDIVSNSPELLRTLTVSVDATVSRRFF